MVAAVRWRITATARPSPGQRAEYKLHRDRDARVQVGVVVVADCGGPVADGGDDKVPRASRSAGTRR